MRITLNLATRPFTDLGPALKRLRIAMGCLALASLLLGLGLHLVHHKAEAVRQHEHSLDGALAHVSAERQGYIAMMHEPDNAKLLEQAAMLNQLFDDKAFSWTLAMESLETVLPGGVQVTALEPVRAKDGKTTTLHLRVVGPRDLGVELVRNLEHSNRFLLPRIVGENSAEQGNGPNQRLEPVSASNRFDFDLLADYNPPTPEERARAKSEEKSKKTPDAQADGGGSPPARAQRVVRQNLPGAAGRPPYTGQSRPVPGRIFKPNPAQAMRPAAGGAR